MPFSNIVGHRQVIELLQRAAARGTVPQSLLLAGPDGVGKHAIAIALAQAVNCPEPRVDGGFDACGVCRTCVRIAKGQHYDVVDLGLDGAASIKLDDLRSRVLDVIGYRPFEAKKRVFIIDPADTLTAQDALLKTLEEPPTSAMIILITTKPDQLLPTVLSRCRRLRCGPLSDTEVSSVLVRTASVDAARARVLAAVAGGSVSRAMAAEAGLLTEDRDAAMAMLSAAASGRVPACLKAATSLTQHDSDRRDREALAARLTVMGSLVRDASALQAGDEGAVLHADLQADLGQLSRSFDRGRLLDAFATIDRARAALARNASPKIVADWVGTQI